MEPTAAATCRVTSVRYTIGLVGLLTDRRRTLQDAIQANLAEGWSLSAVLPPKPSSFDALVQSLCLILTLTIWAQAPGETLVFLRTTR